MSDYHRMELLHLDTNTLIERCITAESMWQENVEKVDRLTAIIAALMPYVQPDMPPEWLRVLLDTGDVEAAWTMRARDEDE